MTKGQETIMEDAIMARPDLLGYPGALAIRNMRLSQYSGRIDVVLLPKTGPRRLVLIEMKEAGAEEAAAKVIGQLLMYYAGVLNFSYKGLKLIRTRLESGQFDPRAKGMKSPKQLAGANSALEGWELLQTPQKKRVKPAEVELFIAVNGTPRDSLTDAVDMLHQAYKLKIKIINVRINNGKGVIKEVRPPK